MASVQDFPLINILPEFVEKFRLWLGIGDTLWLWLAFLVMCLLLVMVLAGIVMYTVLFERKIAGYVQERPGPNRVGWWGVLQTAADVTKLFMKEDIIHDTADKPVFRLAPYFAFMGPFVAMIALPLGPGLAMWHYSSGLLYVFAFSGFAVLGILAGGYASNNKFSLLGGLRGASQLIAYEVPFITAVLAVVLIVGTFDLMKVVEYQSNGLWIAALQPVGFIIFIICMTAETNRTPFDIPEGESEITGGFHTEYSCIRFGIFFLAEYTTLIVMSIFGTVLYLGGWHGPPSFEVIAKSPLSYVNLFWLLIILVLLFAGIKGIREYAKTREFLLLILISFGGIGAILLLMFAAPYVTGFLGFVLSMGIFFAKICFLVFVAMMFRWTFLRMRIDQLTSFAWKFLVPLAVANLVITSVIILLLEGGTAK